ncbi:ABC transporter ATP-binding protein [Shimia sp. R11_0]|uniref:ABC transporter ATP-binding protein n=1 Tax=Shimia sp. R11_0 TaxID=2821096 RepID=UPI001AD95515|nr:ABC transporter ATP-binding protein [Shimia sp. R11_0]MBO9477208.1 ABC transporter ATP-binding protein [Shimia sp. R11_0]
MTELALSVREATWAPRRRDPLLLEATSFDLSKGQVMGIVGPNGAGKTTLLRMIYGYHRPLSGDILVGGESVRQMAPRALARKVAAVLQEQPSDFALTVGEIVALGRVPHRLGFSTPGERDGEIIEAAMARMDLHRLAHRSLSTLSGGERQRVMVARALAQEPELLVLDEPTNHLDIRHQLEVLDLIRELDLTIVTSLHDLNLAADVCDRILMLKNGQPQGYGTPQEVLCANRVSDTFQVKAQREELSLSGKAHLTFQLS